MLMGRLIPLIIGLCVIPFFSPRAVAMEDIYTREGNGWGIDVFQRFFGANIFGRSYAVIIGVGDYDNFKKLDGPSSDAIRMRDFLEAEANYDYIITLTDQDATKE